MKYHSYQIEYVGHAPDFNGDEACQYTVTLGGIDEDELMKQLEDILEKNL